MTQYLRGELFVYQDFLMHSASIQEHNDEILEFHYLMLDFINAYLKRIPALLHLQSHFIANNDLYMIDSNIATLCSYHEVLLMLSNLLGSCPRNHKFFITNDKEPRKDFRRVVAEFNKQVKVGDEEEYDLDECKDNLYKNKVEFGQQVNFINHFATIGGFDSVLNLLKAGANAEEKLDFDIIYQLTTVFKGTYKVLKPEFAREFALGLAE